MPECSRSPRGADAFHVTTGLSGVAVVTLVYRAWLHQTNATTVTLSYLLLVLLIASSSRLWVAVLISVVSMLAVNFFFLPPVGTFTIADPQNWISLFAFLGVSLVASRLSAAARERETIAIERAQLVEERKQAELSQRSAELKSVMLSSLAHDLRTPLTAIRVAATNLRESWPTDAERAEQLEIVLAEVDRLGRLFQNVIEMTRIEAGGISPERQWVHPLEIVEAAETQVAYALRDHPVTVNGEDGVMVFVDPRLTSAALAHLLENAAQYSRPGTLIGVRHRTGADGLLVVVEDNGPGISPVDLSHIFERFYRGEQAKRNTTGTGMGLSISKGLILAQNGRLWAENRQGGGMRFSLLVPAECRVALAAQE